jgi:L-arabinose isomerase
MIKPKVGCYAVYEPSEEGWENLDLQLRQMNEGLAAAGMEVIPAPEAVKDLASCERVSAWFAGHQLDVLHALIITWSFDHYTIMIQQQTGLPVAVRSIPGIRSGSLVAGQQLNCILADIETQHELFFGAPDDPEIASQTAVYAKACAVKNHLKDARLAVIGRRTEGMTPTAVDEVELLRLFGTRLLNFGLDELYDLGTTVPETEAHAEWQKIRRSAKVVTSKEEQGITAARVYLTLKRMIQDFGLQAITIGSYPKCQGTMCLPIALLNEEGIATGCEGDVNSTLAMLILGMLSDQPVHFGEMLDVDLGTNTVVSSHCGCGSPALADDGGYVICPVRLANDGVCIRYTARPGPVTYVNLVGRKGNYRMCAFEGEAVPTEMVFEGTPLKFKMNAPFQKIWKQTVAHGFGHHWMTAYGHVGSVLEKFCGLAQIEGVFPDLG